MKISRMMWFSVLLVCVLSVTFASAAGVDKLLPYQKKVAASPGIGTVTCTFSLFDAETGGLLVWAETKGIAMTSTTRLITTMLGDTVTFDSMSADFSQQLWVQVDCNNQTLGTRDKLAVVPYALWSATSSVPGVPGPQGEPGPQGPPGPDNTAYIDKQIAIEAGARKQGDADTLAADKLYTDQQVAAEALARSTADSKLNDGLQGEIARAKTAEATLTTDLNNEVTRAMGAETVLTNNLAAEVAARKQGDVDTLAADTLYTDKQVAAEASARLAADTALTNNLNNEITRALGAEAALAADLAAEVTARQQGDSNLLTTMTTGYYTKAQVDQMFINQVIAGNQTVTVGLNSTTIIGVNSNVTIGGSSTVSIGANYSATIGASSATSIGANMSTVVGSNSVTQIGADSAVTVGKSSATQVAEDMVIDVGKILTITAADQINIVVGSASIIMKKDGTIQIKGKDITIDGSGQINVKSDLDLVLSKTPIIAP